VPQDCESRLFLSMKTASPSAVFWELLNAGRCGKVSGVSLLIRAHTSGEANALDRTLISWPWPPRFSDWHSTTSDDSRPLMNHCTVVPGIQSSTKLFQTLGVILEQASVPLLCSSRDTLYFATGAHGPRSALMTVNGEAANYRSGFL
jgi:hypothetical protein